MDEEDWTPDIEGVLENIRQNCVLLAEEHKLQYFNLKYLLQFFRLPVIILSGVNSIVSVGLTSYAPQNIISMTTCVLALVCSMIGSIELYLSVQKGMEIELIAQREYYLLSVDIYKTLSLAKQHRPIPALEYLQKQTNEYYKLVENSNTLKTKIQDKLCPL